MGHFEFRLCVKKSRFELVTQFCLDRNVLRLVDGSTYYPISKRSGTYSVFIRLPDRVICEYCVIQWHYRTGWISVVSHLRKCFPMLTL